MQTDIYKRSFIKLSEHLCSSKIMTSGPEYIAKMPVWWEEAQEGVNAVMRRLHLSKQICRSWIKQRQTCSAPVEIAGATCASSHLINSVKAMKGDVMRYRNYIRKTHRFWDIRLQICIICRDLENRVRGPSRSL